MEINKQAISLPSQEDIAILEYIVRNFSYQPGYYFLSITKMLDKVNYMIFVLLNNLDDVNLDKVRRWVDKTSVDLDVDELSACLPKEELGDPLAAFLDFRNRGSVKELLAKLGLSHRGIEFIFDITREALSQKSSQELVEEAFALNNPKEISTVLEQIINPLADIKNQLRGESARSLLMTIVIGTIIIQGIKATRAMYISSRTNADDYDKPAALYKGVSP